MNKPASYFTRLRHRKAPPKARTRRDLLRNEDIERYRQRPARSQQAAHELELANEF